MIRVGLISLLALAACADDRPATAEVSRAAPSYGGVETQLLGDDLVQFTVSMSGVSDPQDIETYAECAAAQYALIRGYGFARHLRTTVDEKGGVWAADAVYTISPSLPRGLETIDAEVVVADCAENGIPTV